MYNAVFSIECMKKCVMKSENQKRTVLTIRNETITFVLGIFNKKGLFKFLT